VDIPPHVAVKMSWHIPEAQYEDEFLRPAAERGVSDLVGQGDPLGPQVLVAKPNEIRSKAEATMVQ